MAKGILRKRNIGLLIKLLIALVALWFIYREVQLKDQVADLDTGVRYLFSLAQLPSLVLLIFLMALNWLLEAIKWRLLIQHLEGISIWQSLKAVLSGITIAIFTPNRVGEYGGRVFHLKKADRIDAVLLTIVGSYAQLVVTITTGIIAGIFFIPTYVGLGPITPMQYNLIGLLLFGVCVFLVILFLNTRLLTVILNWLPIPKKLDHYAQVFQYHSFSTLWKVFLASLGRYVIFTFQFYLLLRIFHIDVDYAPAVMMISLTYFVMTAIPTIAITELGVRGSVAVYFIGLLTTSVTNIFMASSMLWLINLAVPALLGIVFIFQLRFFRKSD